MNIHFKDKELFESLKKATICKVRIGSNLYGTNGTGSDQDFLYIYATSERELKSFIHTNHQLQYKEEGIDHNFVSLHSFIRNILNGESTINFEVVHSIELINTALQFLYDRRHDFISYNIIKSYLGIANRDCKHWTKAETDYAKRKKLFHIMRGYCYASAMIDEMFDFSTIHKLIMGLHFNKAEISLQTVENYSERIKIVRKNLNEKYDNDMLNLPKCIDPKLAILLDQQLINIQNEQFYVVLQMALKDVNRADIQIVELHANALENWVSYENA